MSAGNKSDDMCWCEVCKGRLAISTLQSLAAYNLYVRSTPTRLQRFKRWWKEWSFDDSLTAAEAHVERVCKRIFPLPSDEFMWGIEKFDKLSLISKIILELYVVFVLVVSVTALAPIWLLKTIVRTPRRVVTELRSAFGKDGP